MNEREFPMPLGETWMFTKLKGVREFESDANIADLLNTTRPMSPVVTAVALLKHPIGST
jgi:hypothetical protein